MSTDITEISCRVMENMRLSKYRLGGDVERAFGNLYWVVRDIAKHAPDMLLPEGGCSRESKERIEEMLSIAINEGLKEGAYADDGGNYGTYVEAKFFDRPIHDY